MKADTKRPKNKATTTNDVKSGQNGNANKQTPLRIRDIFVTTSEDTHGRSTKVKTVWFHKDVPETGPRQLKIFILSFLITKLNHQMYCIVKIQFCFKPSQ